VELAGFDGDVHGTRSVVSLVDEDVDAAADGLRGGEPQPLCRARFPEEPLAGADDDRVDLEVQGVDELRAAMNNDVAVVSLFELPDLVDDVAGKDGGVVPVGFGQGLRDDVLGHGVELVREFALVVRPDGSEAVVGEAAEQKASEFIVSSSLNVSPSGPRLKASVQPTRSKLSSPLGASTTPSMDMYSVTTILPIFILPSLLS
jgi:hypothetical protein